MTDYCRCGHDLASPEPHPCHARPDPSRREYSEACGKPASERTQYLVTPDTALAGCQMKVGAYRYTTWACDECWEEFQAQTGGK